MRAMLLLSSLLFALPLLSTFHLSWPISLIVPLVFVVSARRAEDGLIVVAGLLPLATPLGLLTVPVMSSLQVGEMLLLPLLVAVTARSAVRPAAAPTCFELAVSAGSSVIVGATVVQLARDRHSSAFEWTDLWNHVTTGYLSDAASYRALHDGMVWLEGIVLAYVTYLTLRQAPRSAERICRMMLIGAAAASLFTANRLTEVFLRNQLSLRTTSEILAGVRIGIHASDVNAIGSLYALFAVPAFWLAVTGRRVWPWGAFGSIATALWWTRSRAAVFGACCGLLMAALRGRALTRRVIVAGVLLAAVTVALSARSAVRPLSSLAALQIRVEMLGVGMRMLAAHPGFGVGLGQFRSASRGRLSDELATVYPFGENAHNNFVQILAEFGLVGGGAIAAVLGVPLLMSWKALAERDSPPELAGFAGGAAAFLLTWVLGHPLLLPLCLWLFLLVLGTLAGLSCRAISPAGEWVTRATWVFVLSVACSIPWRIQ